LSSFGQGPVFESDTTKDDDNDVVPVVPTVSHWSSLYAQVWHHLRLACTVKLHHHRQHLAQFPLVMQQAIVCSKVLYVGGMFLCYFLTSLQSYVHAHLQDVK